MKLQELAEKIGATVVRGDPARTICGVASLQDAGPDQLAPFTDKFYAPQLKSTRAGAVLAKEPPAELAAHAAVLCCADPELAWLQVIQLLRPAVLEQPGVDPRAVVERGVELGADVYVGPYAVLRRGARIGARSVISAQVCIGRDCILGEGCLLYPQVVIYDGVRLGRGVTVHAGCVVGADGFGYKFRNGRHVKVPQIGAVEIGDEVEIGANTCIDRGALGPTRIGDGTKIDNLVQIGHNVNVGKHCILCGQAAIAGSSGMGDYAVLGGNAGIADHVFMGPGSKAGAKSGIGKDIPAGQEVWGMYADERTQAFRQLAATRRLPELVDRVRSLERELKKLKGEMTAGEEE